MSNNISNRTFFNKPFLKFARLLKLDLPVTFTCTRFHLQTAVSAFFVEPCSSQQDEFSRADLQIRCLQGEEVFEDLVNAGRDRNVAIRMVENYPPKDAGDNDDGKGLQRRGNV